MTFNSPLFLLFLAVGAAAYYAVSAKLQNALLLVLSFVFYMWAAPVYGLTLAITITAGYFFAGQIAKTKSRGVLCLAVVLLVGALVATKYLSFLGTVLSDLFGAALLSGALKIIIPLGISFYTLQLIGYLVDIKNGKAEFERDFVVFALFVAFFPQITSGPIGRAGELIPQYKQIRVFSYNAVSDGLVRFLTGAFKKVALADGLSLIVNGVYGGLASAGGASVALAAALFALQLYFDFSGYTDMALGVAGVFGIRLRENFFAPYFSAGFGEFWRRWHVSLSEWFRDYLYFPLGGNRRGTARALLNTFIVFVVSGLWHGASYGFLVWGALQGVFVIADRLIKLPSSSGAVLRFLRRLSVFALWALSLLFFRLSFSDACGALAKIAAFSTYSQSDLVRALMFCDVGMFGAASVWTKLYFAVTVLGLALCLWFDSKTNRSYLEKSPNMLPVTLLSQRPRWLVYWFMGLSTAYFWLLTTSGSAGQFIYAGF